MHEVRRVGARRRTPRGDRAVERRVAAVGNQCRDVRTVAETLDARARAVTDDRDDGGRRPACAGAHRQVRSIPLRRPGLPDGSLRFAVPLSEHGSTSFPRPRLRCISIRSGRFRCGVPACPTGHSVSPSRSPSTAPLRSLGHASAASPSGPVDSAAASRPARRVTPFRRPASEHGSTWFPRPRLRCISIRTASGRRARRRAARRGRSRRIRHRGSGRTPAPAA